MAGILANSSSSTMTSGDSAVDKVVTGYIRNERITLATYPIASSSYVWALAAPSGSNSAKAYITDTTSSAPALVPDVGGTYTVTCLVDGMTTYTIRISALDTAMSEPAEALRFTPRADAQVAAPAAGCALYWSSTQNALVVKLSDGSVYAIDTTAV